MRGKFWIRALAACLALLLVLGATPFDMLAITASAAEEGTVCGDFTVTGGILDTDFSYADNVLTVKSETPLTISGTTTADRIEVVKDVNANVTLAGVSIDVSAISNAAAFKIANESTGNVTVNLAEGTQNTLKSGKSCAGLHKNGIKGSLTIEGPGSLAAYGGQDGAGIGSGSGMTGSTVTIHGGTIVAVGKQGAGIGAYGAWGRGDVTITGGDVTATGSSIGAGIGGGGTGTVTISGGNVTATASWSGSGIGGFTGSNGKVIITGGIVTASGAVGIGVREDKNEPTEVIISGGTVTATGRYSNPGIKGHFSTGTDGKAIVYASSTGANYSGFSDTSNQSEWTGLIFNEEYGMIGGNFTLPSDFTVESGKTFSIMGSAKLTVPEGVTLTNHGTLTIANGDSMTGSGTITGDGSFFICPLTEDMIIVPTDLVYDYTDKTEVIKSRTTIDTTGITSQIVCGQTFTPDYSAWQQEIRKVNDTLYTVNYTLGSSAVSKNVNVSKPHHLVVEGGTEGSDYTYEGGVVTVLTDTALTIKDSPDRAEGASTDRIEVVKDVSANITLAGVNIDMSGTDNAAAFKIADESTGNVMVTLVGENTLKSGIDAAGLEMNRDFYAKAGTLTIGGDGSLAAIGSGHGTGIGGGSAEINQMDSSGIIINSGTITATGGDGAGIGGGYYGDGSVTINGGTVKATSRNGAGIGGGNYGSGTVSINGGDVEATGGSYSAGIGGGGNSSYNEGTVTITGGTVNATGGSNGGVGIGGSQRSRGNVTISGGTVTATGIGSAAGIGDGPYNNSRQGIFSTGDSGNAWIVATSISDNDDTSAWSGVIFQGSDGQVYGNQTLTADKTIPAGETFTVPSGASLTIPADVTLTIDGTMTIQRGGIASGEGTITGSGTFLTEDLTEDMITVPTGLQYNGTDWTDYIGQNTTLATKTYCGQVFQIAGWTLSVAKVSDLEYTVTYTHTSGETIQKAVILQDCEHTVIPIEAKEPTCTEAGTTAGEKCSLCGKVLVEPQVVPMKEHADENNDGICDNGCGLPMSTYGVVLKGVSATLDGKIGMNYYITLPQSVKADQGAYALFTVNGQATQIMVNEITPAADGRYKFTYLMNAKEMHDTVTFAVYSGSGKMIDLYYTAGTKVEGSSYDYTLAEYFNALIAEYPDETALVNLANATLTYGSYAQIEFNHHPETADSLTDLSDVTVDTLTPYEMQSEGALPDGLTHFGISLILETETTLCLYFEAADGIGQYSFTLDGTAVTPEQTANGSYCIKIPNISAKDLDVTHTLAIGDGCMCTFSALSYAYTAVAENGTDVNLCNAVKALYKYNAAANAYFGG